MKILALLWLLQLPSSLPLYRDDSLVNAASQTNDRFAPNSVATLYGINLSYKTVSATRPELYTAGWRYPTTLGGVRLSLSQLDLELFFVSPTQINFRLPSDLRPSNQSLQLLREGTLGPRLTLRIRDIAPELFTTPDNWLLSTRADGSLVTAEKPARPGETIVFYGTGFGPTIDTTVGLQSAVNWLAQRAAFEVIVNGEPRPGLYYVGTTPGFSALFQVNYTLPNLPEADPEIRVAAQGDRSREGTRLWFKP